jgi:hypothetical protein
MRFTLPQPSAHIHKQPRPRRRASQASANAGPPQRHQPDHEPRYTHTSQGEQHDALAALPDLSSPAVGKLEADETTGIEPSGPAVGIDSVAFNWRETAQNR